MDFLIKRVLLTIGGQKERAIQYLVIGVLTPKNPKSLKSKPKKVFYASCDARDAAKAIAKLLATDNPKPLDIFFNETDPHYYDHYPTHS